MNSAATNPLDQLRDIHLPEPILWWPLAPGWWLLIIMAMVLAAWLVRTLYNKYSARLYRRQALKRLEQLAQVESQQQLHQLFELLKQTANSAYPSLHPGSLGAEAFISFLISSCNKGVFQQLDFDLQQALYSGSSQNDSAQGSEQRDRLYRDARTWIKYHQKHDKLNNMKGQAVC